MMQKRKVVTDHYDRVYWNATANHIDFVIDDSDIKLYTLHPEDVEKEDYAIKCAFIIEPRISALAKGAVYYIEHNADKFDVIFTHDDALLKLPNARLFHWAGAFCDPCDVCKTKNVSIVSSPYDDLPLHRDRLALARHMKALNLGDTFGTFDGGSYVSARHAHAQYRFAVVIENYIEDWWWTEKINNCFLCKTIPIYIGARKIGKIFDEEGIIKANNILDILDILEHMDFEKEYNKRKKAIEYNYIVAQKYMNVFDNLYFNNLDVFERD